MPFTIEQVTPLELITEGDKDPKIIEVQSGELKEVGDHKVVSKPQFKEDREERSVVFRGEIEQGAVEVHVTYSLGMDGHQVENVEVVTVPAGLTVHSEPEFETQDC
ncbi:hypothetical protein [Burkholderia gladioli]|uniref:hypothetical protein n=1 Tax=Burkholderia gladioli TaxID=28095 RepID=UPI00163E1DB5|nr:hypothetical protein [Burkholderia gladioli]